MRTESPENKAQLDAWWAARHVAGPPPEDPALHPSEKERAAEAEAQAGVAAAEAAVCAASRATIAARATSRRLREDIAVRGSDGLGDLRRRGSTGEIRAADAALAAAESELLERGAAAQKARRDLLHLSANIGRAVRARTFEETNRASFAEWSRRHPDATREQVHAAELTYKLREPDKGDTDTIRTRPTSSGGWETGI